MNMLNNSNQKNNHILLPLIIRIITTDITLDNENCFDGNITIIAT